MDFYIDETVYTGSPEDMSGRLPREIRTYALLDTLGIPFTRVDHDATATIDACLEGPGAESTEASGEGLTGGPGETAGEDKENPENLEIPENSENPDDPEDPGGDGGQTKEKTAGEPQGRLELMASSRGGDLEIFMECKDEFLKEVKEKRISSYEPAYITEVRILVNPADMEAVEENR